MPSAMITLENVNNRWVCSVEAQDARLAVRRENIVAESFDEAILAVVESYRRRVPEDAKPKVVKADVPLEPVALPEGGFKVVSRRDRNRSQREAAEGMGEPQDPDADEPSLADIEAEDAAELASIEALRAEAAGLGIEVDGRWGERRLRQEIEAKS